MRWGTYECRQASCSYETHPVTVVHPIFSVPNEKRIELACIIVDKKSNREAYEFDRNELTVEQIDAFKDDAETSLSNLLPNSKMLANNARVAASRRLRVRRGRRCHAA
jgi:hypothetical protein